MAFSLAMSAVDRDAVDLAVEALAGERGRTDVGLVRVGQAQCLDLVRVDHGQHLTAAALEEDVRRGARVERGLQLAVEALVLDVLHLDRHARVGRVIGLHGVLEVRKAGTGDSVRPEGQRDRAVGGRAVAAAAASGTGGGSQSDAEAECGYRRSGGFLHHRRNSLSELGTTTSPKTLRGSGGNCPAATHGRLLELGTSHFRKFSNTFDVPPS